MASTALQALSFDRGPSTEPGRDGRRPRRRGPATVTGLLPPVLLGAVAVWGWRSPSGDVGHLPTVAVLVVGGVAVLYLLLWVVLLGLRATPPAQPTPPARMSAPAWTSAPARSAPAGATWSSPVPQAPAVITGVPGGSPRSEVAPDWQERTAVPPQRRTPPAASAASWAVVLDDGRTVALDRPVVFGRDPAALPGEQELELRPIADETRTVSKTHVRLDPGADSVLVTDRHSTNGVVVITAGVATRCRAGEPMVATQGSVVRFGDREMQVRRQ